MSSPPDSSTAAPAATHAGAASATRRPYFWYRIGHGHLRTIRAEDEDAARAAILAAQPHARGQRLTVIPVR